MKPEMERGTREICIWQRRDEEEKTRELIIDLDENITTSLIKTFSQKNSRKIQSKVHVESLEQERRIESSSHQ